MKKLFNWLFPTWEVIYMEHYYDTSWGIRQPSTTVTWKSSNGRIKTKNLYGAGFLEKEDLVGSHP